MADPLSIASGVAGLVSLGLTLCSGLNNYFNAVKGRHQDIEIASQSVTLLESNLFIIQSSTLKLGHRHALSADGVNRGMANCKSQLVALQQMISDLTRDESLSDLKGKLRNQMTIARYPFNQKKLIQLQNQLSSANATLGNLVQNLNLDINTGISEDLLVLRNYTKASDNMTHNMIGTIAKRLDAIGPAVQRAEMEVAAISRHMQSNSLVTSICNPGDFAKPRYLQNSHKEESIVKRLNDPECTCSDPSTTSIRRQSSYVDPSWWGLAISKHEHLQRRHRPGCVLSSQSLRTSKTTFTYFGLRHWLARSLSTSLKRDYPAGAYSLSFGIQSCNVVKSSPVFQVFRNLAGNRLPSPLFNEHIDIREQISFVIQKLRTIYSSGAASPFDVDVYGNSIAHWSLYSLEFYLNRLSDWKVEEGTSFKINFEAICSLLFYLFDIGVSISAPNFYQHTILHYLYEPRYIRALPYFYNFIEKLDKSFCSEGFTNKETKYLMCKAEHEFEYLQAWEDYPDIAEAFGFNDVFVTVLQRDRQKLAAITMDDQLPPGIFETDIYGRNILHVSITWPEGLALLLHHQAVSRLCDDASTTISPLQVAMRLSGRNCTQKYRWEMCHNCHCSDSVQLMVEADCCIPVHLLAVEYLSLCSYKCRRLLFQHSQNRRQRLRDLSLAILPSQVIDRYGITVECVPDATATYLWGELQSNYDEVRMRRIEVSWALKPFYLNHYSGGLFENSLCPELCSLAVEFGMRPSDESGIGPLLARIRVLAYNDWRTRFDYYDVTYLSWLMKHDLKLEYIIDGFQTSALHDIGARIGGFLLPSPFGYFYEDLGPGYLWQGEGIMLITKICNSKIESNLPCPCGSSGFNRPLGSLLSGFVANEHWDGPWEVDITRKVFLLVALIEDKIASIDTSHLAKCATHAITMELLGIRHVGPCARNRENQEMGESDVSDWAEVLDEDRLLLQRLHDLDEEFEREFEIRNESVVDFIAGYYYQRMLEVDEELDASLADDHRQGLLAAGVVLSE